MPPLLLPLAFATLYGTGFVGAKLGLPNAQPLTFLACRFTLAALILALIAFSLRAPWPGNRRATLAVAGSGLLSVGAFSAGVFYSIALGVPPAVSALIIALNPILVALGAAFLLGEKISRRQRFGLMLGLFGVYWVLHQRLLFDHAYWQAAGFSVLGLFALAAGNLYQKACCGQMNVFSGGAIQCAVSAFAAWGGAWLCESMNIHWNADFIIALIWMAVVVSVGAVSLLNVMIRRDEISRVASVFYLLPVSAALTAYFLFDQRLDASAAGGIGVTALGILLVTVRLPAASWRTALPWWFSRAR